MELFHHSRSPIYRDPQGAVPAGGIVTLSLSVSDSGADPGVGSDFSVSACPGLSSDFGIGSDMACYLVVFPESVARESFEGRGEDGCDKDHAIFGGAVDNGCGNGSDPAANRADLDTCAAANTPHAGAVESSKACPARHPDPISIDEPTATFDQPHQTQEIPMKHTLSENRGSVFSVTVRLPETPCLCWYHFRVKIGDCQLFYGNAADGLGGAGQPYDHDPMPYQITVYQPSSVPSWYKHAIVYQIFPDRFARDTEWMRRQAQAFEDFGVEGFGAGEFGACAENGPGRVVQQDWYDAPYYTRDPEGRVTRWPFFGGSLEGIRGRLLYLKSLGVGAVYLNPIFSARSNHKYDTADYTKIDPSFGTDDDFRKLAEDARRLGIRLILDGVFNHTGADSLYFNKFGHYPNKGACQGTDSPYYSWYDFSDFPDEYACWWGVKDLPAVNENDPSYRSFICDDVIKRWMSEGASGWRLDVADELPDSFIRGLRAAVKSEEPDGLLIGEVWEDASNKVSYDKRRAYLLGNELDGIMNYPFRDMLLEYMLGVISADTAARRFLSLSENYPEEHFYAALNLIGSHDRARALTLLGDAPDEMSDAEKERYRLPDDKRALARQRLKALSLLQFILPGVPCVYYGDEAGAEGFEDPFNRGTYPWGREDVDLLYHYRMLAILRRQYDILTDGDFELSSHGEHVLICRRFADEDEQIILAVNRHLFGDVSVDIDLPKDHAFIIDLLTAEDISGSLENGRLTVSMPPLSFRLIYTKKTAPVKVDMPRGAGVLCHVSSIPGELTPGCSERFIDFLSSAGQKLWQILPLNPTDETGNSPYSSLAVFAGNTRLYADICTAADFDRDNEDYIDSDDFDDFCRQESFWLEDYALYTVLKKHFDGLPWQEWPTPERDRVNIGFWKEKAGDDIENIKREQYAFWRRWDQIRAYANEKKIAIIGDLPIYPNEDSADTWAHRSCFLLDNDGYPLAGAGVPPDYFNEDGQNWGNPLYDWDAMKKDGYRWWRERLSHALRHHDYLRVDHFRSFSAFYAIPRGKTARDGLWLPGPGKGFFDTMYRDLGPLPLLAEDLGLLDAQVYTLLKQTGFPGMLVYQFSSEEMENIDAAAASEKIFYTGTHDNQTLAGWCANRHAAAGGKCDMSDSSDPDTPDHMPARIIEKLYESRAPWVIAPLQDMLGLGDDSRMNTPGEPEGNWRWRFDENALTPELAVRFAHLADITDR